MGGGPPKKDDGVGQIQTTLHLMFFLGRFLFLLKNKYNNGNSGYLDCIFCCLGAQGVPLGWQIGDAPPQRDDGVG